MSPYGGARFQVQLPITIPADEMEPLPGETGEIPLAELTTGPGEQRD